MVWAFRNLVGFIGNAFFAHTVIQIVYDLVGRRIDHDLRSVGCAVLINDRPRVIRGHADRLDFTGWYRSNYRRDGF